MALGAAPPTITLGANPVSGDIGSIASVPTFTITGDVPLAVIDWNFTLTATNSGISSIATPTDNGDGPYKLHARQTPLDPFDLPGEATVTFNLDRFAAAPVISSAVPAANATSATFVWTGEGPTFTCSLAAPPVPGFGFAPQSCPGGSVTAPLTTGTYTFSVSTTDSVGNTSAPASQTFTVDTAAPAGGSIAHAPVANQVAGFTKSGSVTINLTSASLDNVTLQPQIAYALSTTNLVAPGPAAFQLWTGPRTFSVTPTQGATTPVFLWARDQAGNAAVVTPIPLRITFDNQPPFVLNSSFPLPGLNLTTAFGPLANVQINFNEPVQNPASLIRLCVNSPCGLAIPSAVTPSNTTATAILDPFPATPATGLAVATTYSIELPFVRDPAGNLLTGPGSSPWTFTTSADGTPPGPVTRLAATPGIGQIALAWTPPTDPDLARITVLRGTSPPASAADGTAARVTLPANAKSFTDVALAPGVTYHYAVYTEDAVGNPSVLARLSGVPKGLPVATPKRPKPPRTHSARFMVPKKGKVIRTLRPLLRWKGKKGAIIYNIQIVDLNTARKVVSAFPKAPRYKVPKGRLKRDHRFAWRVWAWRGKVKGYVKVPMTTWFDTSPKAKL